MEFFTHLLGDTTFWVAVSTVLCFGFIGFKAYKPLLQGLDGRAEMIRQRLAEADQLRVEAENLLEEYKAKSENALNEAQEVLQNAQRRADQMRKQMEGEIAEMIKRQEANAKMRIARLEQETIETVKNAIITASLNHVKRDVADKGLESSALEKSVDQIVKTLH